MPGTNCDVNPFRVDIAKILDPIPPQLAIKNLLVFEISQEGMNRMKRG